MPSSSEKKNFEDEILCSYVPTCDTPPPPPPGGTNLDPGASPKQFGRGPLYIPNKIFKNFLLYLYAKSKKKKHRTNFFSRAII